MCLVVFIGVYLVVLVYCLFKLQVPHSDAARPVVVEEAEDLRRVVCKEIIPPP